MAVDFSEKAKRYQAIDEIIASGRKLKWKEIIQELQDKYEIHTSRTSFFRDIEELQKNIAHLSTQTLKRAATFIQTLTTVCPDCTQMKTPQKPPPLFPGRNKKSSADKKNPGPDGDGIILSFKSNQLFSIQRWTWQWADEAFPLAPPELVDDWKQKLERIPQLHS